MREPGALRISPADLHCPEHGGRPGRGSANLPWLGRFIAGCAFSGGYLWISRTIKPEPSLAFGYEGCTDSGMNKGLEIKEAPGYGALLGMFLGMLEQFCHAFCPTSWQHSPGENLFAHVLIEVVIGAFAGASLLAAISAIRNWLMQDR